MSASDVNTAMAAAQSALASADYATALDKAIAAQGYLATLPNSAMKGGETTSMEWDPKKIQDFIDNIRGRRSESQAASLGIQRTKIQHASPSAPI